MGVRFGFCSVSCVVLSLTSMWASCVRKLFMSSCVKVIARFVMMHSAAAQVHFYVCMRSRRSSGHKCSAGLTMQEDDVDVGDSIRVSSQRMIGKACSS